MDLKAISQRLFDIIVFVGCLAFLTGCGASRQSVPGDKSVNIDELLGDDNVEANDEKTNEQEVLRLLGVKPEEETVVNADAQVLEDTKTKEFNDDLERLKQDLAEKDREISELRSELTVKEMKIGDLETSKAASEKKPQIVLEKETTEPSSDFESEYKRGLEQYRARNYESAMAVFSALIQKNPNTTLSDNCQYWIGECYFARFNYNQAIVEFERVFSFTNSNKSDDALLKLGVSYLKLGEKEQAKSEFLSLISSYPTSEYKNLAQKYLSEL